jgi:hypothetical protein
VRTFLQESGQRKELVTMEDEKELLDDIYEDFDQKLSNNGLRDYEEVFVVINNNKQESQAFG